MKKYGVYRNLNRKCWSIKDRKIKRIVGYSDSVLFRDCLLWVSEKGRQRVLRRKQKGLHAEVRGQICSLMNPKLINDWVEIKYNPYHKGSFYRLDTSESITEAAYVYLSPQMRVYAVLK